MPYFSCGGKNDVSSLGTFSVALVLSLAPVATVRGDVDGGEKNEVVPESADSVFRAGLVVPSHLTDPREAKPLHLPESFPIPMTFWSFMKCPPDQYAERLEEQAPYPVVHGVGPYKLENLCRVVKERWPEKIVIRQSAYGGLGAQLANKAWSGHFLYKVGTKLSRDCKPDDLTIRVENFKCILRSPAELASREFPLTFTIYALDNEGNPDWSHAEMVTLKSVAKTGELTVKRGAWGTQPLAFKSDRAVAATNMMFWTRQFQMNFSLQCPRGGPDNLTAAEWFARHEAEEVKRTGADGIEFDVGRWTWGNPTHNPLDCNNDLVPDYGYLDGVCSFGLGGRVFFRELRTLLGPNKIIQVDGNSPAGLRGWDYLNGVQMECFPAENRFERFSEVFAHLRRWSENAGASPKFSYGFTKTATTLYANARLPDGSPTDFRFRVGLAADCLVGMPHPFLSLSDNGFDPANETDKNKQVVSSPGVFDWDECHGGDLNDWQWLGKPLGPAKQHLDDLSQEDLLAGSAWEWKEGGGFEAECGVADGVASATVTRIPEKTIPSDLWFGVRLQPKAKPALKPDTEYTLEFDVRGDDRWDSGGEVFEHVPRTVMISGIGEGRASVNADARWYHCLISMTTGDAPDQDIAFGVSEQTGRTEIKNIRLYEGGAERWSRDFEHGKILLNMTRHPWKADVGSGFRRLKGDKCPDLNNGAKVDGAIGVPVWDAVFLVSGAGEKSN